MDSAVTEDMVVRTATMRISSLADLPVVQSSLVLLTLALEVKVATEAARQRQKSYQMKLQNKIYIAPSISCMIVRSCWINSIPL